MPSGNFQFGPRTLWRCGHCMSGPYTVDIDTHCTEFNCLKQRDCYSMITTIHPTDDEIDLMRKDMRGGRGSKQVRFVTTPENPQPNLEQSELERPGLEELNPEQPKLEQLEPELTEQERAEPEQRESGQREGTPIKLEEEEDQKDTHRRKRVKREAEVKTAASSRPKRTLSDPDYRGL